jgi:hypothetical protein
VLRGAVVLAGWAFGVDPVQNVPLRDQGAA